MNELSRREFLESVGALSGSFLLRRFNLDTAEVLAQPEEPLKLSRKEHFEPFESGRAEWQYVSFQYNNEGEQRVGIVLSMSELTGSFGTKKHQFLVMKHNLDTKETIQNTYDGRRVFNKADSTYTFEDEGGDQVATFSYDDLSGNYVLNIHTEVFNSDEIDDEGLILAPQGDLIPVSKDGRFTVASAGGGKVNTNYFADHVKVKKSSGETIGFGRRDSQNLEIEGWLPSNLDIDHNWVHVSGDLRAGREVYITAWKSQTGGEFRFADVMVVNSVTGEVDLIVQLNEENSDFELDFKPHLSEQELPPGAKYKLAHGGKISARLGGEGLFELEVDGDPGQVIDGKGMLEMTEAHGRLTAGTVLGHDILSGNSAVWESTDERYSVLLPIIKDS